MEVGSLVECTIQVRHINLRALLAYLSGQDLPEKGQYYLVKGIEPCTCGKHNVIQLEGITADWDERLFEERQGPGEVDEVNIDKLLNS